MNVELSGIAATAAQPGEAIMVWTKLPITSDEPAFHRIVESLNSVISHSVQQTGATFAWVTPIMCCWLFTVITAPNFGSILPPSQLK